MNLINHVENALQSEDAQQIQVFRKQRFWDRLNFALLLHMNENLPILLVGVTLAFAVERLMGMLDARVSDDVIAFFILALQALLWVFVSVAHVLYTLSFIIIQNSLPSTPLKSDSSRVLKAFVFIFLDDDDTKLKLFTLRRCSIALCCLICLLLFLGICGFLYRNDVFYIAAR